MNERVRPMTEAPKSGKLKNNLSKKAALALVAPVLAAAAFGGVKLAGGGSNPENASSSPSYSMNEINPLDILADFPSARGKITPPPCECERPVIVPPNVGDGGLLNMGEPVLVRASVNPGDSSDRVV